MNIKGAWAGTLPAAEAREEGASWGCRREPLDDCSENERIRCAPRASGGHVVFVPHMHVGRGKRHCLQHLEEKKPRGDGAEPPSKLGEGTLGG